MNWHIAYLEQGHLILVQMKGVIV